MVERGWTIRTGDDGGGKDLASGLAGGELRGREGGGEKGEEGCGEHLGGAVGVVCVQVLYEW